MGPRERVWGYTGASGMVQGFAAGYFLWDLVTSAGNLDVHGSDFPSPSFFCSSRSGALRQFLGAHVLPPKR